MNTQLLNAKSLFSIAVIAACVALSGPVQAESHKVMVKIPVSAAGLDLNQPAGASELYSRLRQAARTACRDGGRVGLEPVKNFTGCCEQALGGAIMIAIAIFGALASSMSAVCTAADSTDAPQSTVKYEDLNVSGAQGAVALYTRIRHAADTVCRPSNNRDLASKMRMQSCIRKAIADAVTTVNEPALFAVYNAKNQKTLPIILAAGKTR